MRAFLFVLVRDIEEFTGSPTELEVLALVQDLGFTSFWNVPLRTVHEGCTYTESPSADLRGTSGEGSGVEGLRGVKCLFPWRTVMKAVRGTMKLFFLA